MARKTPLCMSSYKYLFNATRLPTAPSDTAKVYDPESHNHVVVVRKGKFYEVPVVDDKGEWLSEKELETCVHLSLALRSWREALTDVSRATCRLFQKVVETAGSEADAHPLGALTAADRDLWTKVRLLYRPQFFAECSELTHVRLQARGELIQDPANLKALERIESAIIIVSLDSNKPYTREEKSWGLWVGDGKDRWFDKHQRASLRLSDALEPGCAGGC